MHATKTFSVGEGGLIYSGDADRIEQLRAMVNFGFESGPCDSAGINAKMPEVLGLMARSKLAELDSICDARAALDREYRDALTGWTFQPMTAKRQATQFMPVLLPAELAPHRAAVIGALAADGVGAGQYFSPHLGEQALFRDTALIEATPVADDVSARMLSLPITDAMRPGDAAIVAERLRNAVARVAGMSDVAQMRGDTARGCLIIGGGPAGTAVLTAASKKGLLERLAGRG